RTSTSSSARRMGPTSTGRMVAPSVAARRRESSTAARTTGRRASPVKGLGREATAPRWRQRSARSMPGLTGDEALERIRLDPRLRAIPVVVVSSEKERAERCLQRGAVASLPKPFTGEALLSVVLAAVEDSRRRAATEGATILPVEVGPMRLALELVDVRSVASQPRSALLPAAQGAVSRFIEFEGRPLLLLDLATRLGVKYRHGAADRMVVVVRAGARMLGVSVDAVDIPEEI